MTSQLKKENKNMFYFIFVLTIISVGGQNCPSSVSPSVSPPVSICSNGDSRSGRNVYLSGFKDGEGDHTCQCSLTLIKPVSTRSLVGIINQNNIPSTCDYSLILVVKNKRDSTIYDCSKGSHLTRKFVMKHGDEVLLKLRNGTFSNAGFQFCIRFVATERSDSFKLNCSSKNGGRNNVTDTTTPEEKQSTPTTTGNQNGGKTNVPDITTSDNIDENINKVTRTPTGNSDSPSTNQDTSDTDCEQEVDVVPWVLFGLLLTLNLALLIFFVTRRFVHRRKQKPAVVDRSRTYRNHTSSPNNQTSHSNQGENNQQQPEDDGTSVSYTNIPNNRIEGRHHGTSNDRNDLDTQYDSLQTAEQEATPYYTSLKLKEENDYIN